MDMHEIKHIKAKLQEGPVNELQASEYLIKVRNFLSLNPNKVPKSLAAEF